MSTSMVSIVSFGEPASRDCMLMPFAVRTDEMGITPHSYYAKVTERSAP